MHFRLFDRPLIIDGQLASMYIDGQYDDYDSGEDYEGRVQIHGSVGFTKVEVLSSNLPPGYYVYVDNISKEVVVKWDKYTPPVETVTLLENGDFSAGDTGSWTNTGPGRPFVIEPDSSGNMSMKFNSGFSGGHYSESPLAPVENINRQITVTGRIAQGKSSKRKLWGGLVLTFHDADRNYLNHQEGDWINSGGDYQDARVIAAPTNPLTKFVSVRLHWDRKGQNHPGWMRDIKWDHVWTKGYNSDEELFVEVKVTDALNNSAVHRGVIEERNLWATSGLYPLLTYDSIAATGGLTAAQVFNSWDSFGTDSIAPTVGLLSVTMRDNSVLAEDVVDGLTVVPLIVGVTLRDSLIDNATSEAVSVSPSFSVLMKTIAVDPGSSIDSIKPSVAIKGVILQ